METIGHGTDSPGYGAVTWLQVSKSIGKVSAARPKTDHENVYHVEIAYYIRSSSV
jgi:hypothetical protein